MAVTWAVAAPHRDAVAKLGAAATISGASAVVAYAGNKRARLAQLTATGTYATGGNTVAVGDLGLASVEAVFILSDSDTDIDPIMANATDAGGIPVFDLTDQAAPKVKLVDKTAELTAADVVTGTTFHALFIGT